MKNITFFVLVLLLFTNININMAYAMFSAPDVVPIAIVGLLFALYFLPTIIANKREHPNKKPIILINICLGWTLLGWFAALIWSVSAINPALISSTIRELKEVSPMTWKIKTLHNEFTAESIDELKQWYREKRLSPDTYVYHPVLEKWMYAKDL